MELRDIEIFLTLAEELHFGRTARRLHITQARVSQAIKAQERRLGGKLFERTSRAVTLTPLGEQLRDDLRSGYETIQQGLARAAESARDRRATVRIGVMGAVGHEISDVIDYFQDRHHGYRVTLQEVHFSDPFSAVRAGHLDLALLWRPVSETDLTEGPVLLTEGRVLAVPTGHELAHRPSVSMEDMGDRVFLDVDKALPAEWMAAMLPTHTPSGRPLLRGPQVATFHEVLTLVAAGHCLTPLNQHVLDYYTHPGVVFLPIHDAPVTEWALVHRQGELPVPVSEFLETARALGPRQYGKPKRAT